MHFQRVFPLGPTQSFAYPPTLTFTPPTLAPTEPPTLTPPVPTDTPIPAVGRMGGASAPQAVRPATSASALKIRFTSISLSSPQYGRALDRVRCRHRTGVSLLNYAHQARQTRLR